METKSYIKITNVYISLEKDLKNKNKKGTFIKRRKSGRNTLL